jgi:hypothetical protein
MRKYGFVVSAFPPGLVAALSSSTIQKTKNQLKKR